MICDGCGKCQGITDKGGVYEIACVEKGGFQLHSTHEFNFTCDDYVERKVRPKDNVVVILAESGRDITLYDEKIQSISDITHLMNSMLYDEDFIQLGNFIFSKDDIACMGVINSGK